MNEKTNDPALKEMLGGMQKQAMELDGLIKAIRAVADKHPDHGDDLKACAKYAKKLDKHLAGLPADITAEIVGEFLNQLFLTPRDHPFGMIPPPVLPGVDK